MQKLRRHREKAFRGAWVDAIESAVAPMQKLHRQECLCYLCGILPDHGREEEKIDKAFEDEIFEGETFERGYRNYREEAC